MANGHPGGNGSIRISAKAAGLILTLVIAAGGGVTSGIALVRWAIRTEAKVDATVALRVTVDSMKSASQEFRLRVNNVLTDQERRIRTLEARAGIPREP